MPPRDVAENPLQNYLTTKVTKKGRKEHKERAIDVGAGLPKASIEIDASPERKTPILFVTMYARPGSGFLRLTLRSREKDVVQNQPVAG